MAAFIWLVCLFLSLVSGQRMTDANLATPATTKISEWCKDNSTLNCWYYPDEKCVGAYEGWARVYCPYRCGYCPNFYPPCQDLDSYCAAFRNGSCTDTRYRAYMREHCRRYCNECHYPGQNLLPISPPPTTDINTGASTVNTVHAKEASEWCKDNSTLNCWYYPDEKCVGASEGWARAYCPYRCGYCPNFYPPCEDLDSNCAVFVNGSCSNVLYRAYMREHCRRHCNECYYPGQDLTPNIPPDSVLVITTTSNVNTPVMAGSVSPTTLGRATGDDCKDAVDCSTYSSESCVGVFKTWAIRNCPRTCGYCTGTTDCRDYEECDKLHDDVCSNPTYRRIAETSCRKFCKLCTATLVPTKPVVTGTTEAMMVPTKAPVSEAATGHQTDQTTTEIVSMEPSQAGSEVVSVPTKPAASEVMTSAFSLTTHQAMSTTPGLMCPECDTHFNCVWNRVCYPGEVCMLRQYPNYPFSVHCSKKADCIFMKMNLKGADILCCEEHTCITDIIP
nr:uncharacterized protein LOC105326186 isoform X3 [Crassostrea gigas]